MLYSIKGSRTRIYPGTIQLHLAFNVKPRYNLTSYRCQPDTSFYSIYAKPMGAISWAIDVNKDTSSYSINAKPMGKIFLSAIDVDKDTSY